VLQLLRGAAVNAALGGVKAVLGVALGTALAVVIACGGAQHAAKSSAPPAQAATAAAPAGEANPRDEIAALDREITAQLDSAHVVPPEAASCTGAACAEAMSQPYSAPAPTDPACRPAPSDRCKDVCSLSGSICKNQDRICELARQLAGDDWAANKCSRARTSCQAAHDSCCSCVL
jgi:hypothetical protein